jgi:L-lactate dehydrogenase complex protein LldG
MEETTSREKVLKSVRNALVSKTEPVIPSIDTESSVYPNFEDTLDIVFAQEFTKIAGKFIYCESEDDCILNLKSLVKELKLKKLFCADQKLIQMLQKSKIPVITETEDFLKMDSAITYCEYLIARLGSIMISSKQTSGRRLNVFPENHIVIAYTSQIVADIKDALKNIHNQYDGKLPSLISVISGPSRTADIEKTLVMGAHGPKNLYLLLIDEE